MTSKNNTLISANWRIIRRCNAKCSFCNHWRDRSWKNQEYDMPMIVQIYDQLNSLGVKKVILNGGEPLLHPLFSSAVQYGKYLGMQITVNSNGMLLSKEKSKEIIDAGLDGILVSLHSSSPHLHNKIKKVAGGWQKTIEGLKYLRAYSKDLNIRINVVLIKDNYLTALEIAKLASSLEVNSIQFSQVDNLREVTNTRARLDDAMQEKFYFDIYPEVIQYCAEKNIATKVSPLPHQLLGDELNDLGINKEYSKNTINSLTSPSIALKEEISLYSTGMYGASFYAKHSCFVPESTTYIMANGDVYPCVRAIGFEDSNDIMGNLYQLSLKDIITSEKNQQFISMAGKKEVCKTCKNLHNVNLYKGSKAV